MHNVISAFEDRAAADRAVERLAEAGFDRSAIHVEDRSMSGAPLADGSEVHRHHGIGHFFRMLFGEDDRAGDSGKYSEAVRRGNCVVVVDAADEAQAQRASALMNELGAYDIDARADQWRAGGWTGYDVAGGDAAIARDGKLNVVQEELQVGKRQVDKGGVRIVQRVTEKPVREIVRLREEIANVERRPVDRPATPEDLNTFREGTMEVREMAEEPVVAKTARVVEEVVVGKDVREREQTVEDTVRRKDVDVQRMEGTGVRGDVAREERAIAADQRRERDLLDERSRDPLDKDKPI